MKTREQLELALARLTERRRIVEAQMGRASMPGTSITGASGVPASRMRRIHANLDRQIQLGCQHVSLSQEIDWVEGRIAAFGRVKETREPVIPLIAVGDHIDVGGNHLLEVVKVNRKSVRTALSSWTESEIVRVVKSNA